MIIFKKVFPNIYTGEVENKKFTQLITVNEELHLSDDNLLKYDNAFEQSTFSLIDEYIDSTNQRLQGKQFAEKINKFVPKDTKEEILKKCYEILLVYRNALEHEKNSISTNNCLLFVNRTNKSSDKLEITCDGMNMINSLPLLIFLSDILIGDYSDYQKDLFYISYYNSIFNAITIFNKNNKSKKDLTLTISLPSIRYSSRVIVRNVPYVVNGDNIFLETILDRDYCNKNGWDYFLEYKHNKYIVPTEMLDLHNSISTLEIEKYKVS